MNLKKSKWFKHKRYQAIKLLIKIITPRLLEEIKSVNLEGMGFRMKEFNYISKKPRPAIIFIKNYFNEKYLIGCEMGVSKGANAQNILKELNIKKLYLIDEYKFYGGIVTQEIHNKTYNDVCNLFKENNKVEIIKKDSFLASKLIKDNELDFIYIDGNHKFDYVLKDLDAWYPKIKEGGIISGHDILNAYANDVLKAVKEFCNNNNQSYTIDVPDFYIIKKGAGIK